MNALDMERQQDEEFREVCCRVARDGVAGTARRLLQQSELIHAQAARIQELDVLLAALRSEGGTARLLDLVEQQEEELARLRSYLGTGVVVAQTPLLLEDTGD